MNKQQKFGFVNYDLQVDRIGNHKLRIKIKTSCEPVNHGNLLHRLNSMLPRGTWFDMIGIG